MTRNNMAMSFVILAILTSPAVGDEFCSTLLTAVAESKTGFVKYRRSGAANNPYEQKQSGWSTPFRLANSEFCFIDDTVRPDETVRPSLICTMVLPQSAACCRSSKAASVVTGRCRLESDSRKGTLQVCQTTTE